MRGHALWLASVSLAALMAACSRPCHFTVEQSPPQPKRWPACDDRRQAPAFQYRELPRQALDPPGPSSATWSDTEWSTYLGCDPGTSVQHPDGRPGAFSCLDSTGARHGWSITLGSHREVTELAQWRHGHRNGLRIRGNVLELGPASAPAVVSHYADGHQEGRYQEVSRAMVLKDGTFHQGARDDCWSAWYPNGKRAWSGTYDHGALDGAWHTWRPDGSPWAYGLFTLGRLDRREIADENGTWRLVPPQPASCNRIVQQTLEGAADQGHELQSFCLLNMTPAQADCFLHAESADAQTKCLSAQ